MARVPGRGPHSVRLHPHGVPGPPGGPAGAVRRSTRFRSSPFGQASFPAPPPIRRDRAVQLHPGPPQYEQNPVTRSAAITRMRNTCQPPCLRRLSGLTRAGRGFGVGQGRWFRHECSHIRLGAWLWVTSAVDRGLTGWCWWPPRAAMTVIPAGTATLGSARPVRKLQRWWLWDLSDFGRQLRDLRHWP